MRALFTLLLIITFANTFSQCNQAEPFCTGTTYTFPMETNTNAENGPDYACLSTQPNPVWYYLLIDQPGNIFISIESPTGNDVDFICWGPFNSPTTPCTAQLTANCTFCPNNTSDPSFYPSGMTVDCSYDPADYETCHIYNAQSGKYYILCITNYEDEPGTLTFTQTGGNGSTNCNIVFCSMNSLTAFPSNCFAGNYYNLIGTITFNDAPATGQLIVSDNSGVNHIYYPPFTSPLNYTLDNIVADGLTHTITAYFTDAPTCSKTVTYDSPEPCGCMVNAGADFDVCGLDADLNAVTQTGDHNMHWTTVTPGAVFADQSNPLSSVNVGNYGVYQFAWTITNDLNETCSDTITVGFYPFPDISAALSDDTICSGELLTLSADGAGTGGTYVWSNGLGAGQNIEDFPQYSTTYTVTGTDEHQCSDSAFVSVFVYRSPQIALTAVDEHCFKSDGQIQSVISEGLPPYSYVWNNGATSTNLDSVTAATYTLSVTDMNQCLSQASIQVYNIPGPNADFFTSPERIYPLTPVTFIDYSSGNVTSWYWEFGDGASDVVENPMHSYAIAGYYPVRLWVSDDAGCRDSVFKEVAVKEVYSFYLPNAISPNGNGINDLFHPFATYIEPYGYFIKIYNRWGELLFSTTDINKSWDGTFNNALVPTGVYIYFVKFVDGDGLPHEIRGEVNVFY